MRTDFLMLGTIGAVGLSAVAVFDPATSPLFPPCIWRTVTGWLCPGCGSARAIHALMHGHIVVALYTNPLAVAAMPAAAVDVIQRWRRRGSPLTYCVRPVVVRALAGAIVLFGFLRNFQ
jgi:Protein of unknown function (DUF2752)